MSSAPLPPARPAVSLEPMRLEHVPAVAAIEAAASASPWSEGLFRAEFDVAPEARSWLVAVRGGRTLGFAGAMYVADEAHVMNIAVDPGLRRQGLGRLLFRGLVDEAVGRGIRHLTLEVRVSNVAARELYRRFGLAPAGIRRRYYPDGEDALVMWAHDIDAPAFAQRLDRPWGAAS